MQTNIMWSHGRTQELHRGGGRVSIIRIFPENENLIPSTHYLLKIGIVKIYATFLIMYGIVQIFKKKEEVLNLFRFTPLK